MITTTLAFLVTSANELCYTVNVNGEDGPESFVVQPIKKFPQGHVLTGTYQPATSKSTLPQCGQSFVVGQPIPHSGVWADAYERDNTSRCTYAPSARLFYSYNNPSGASSNTGFETSDAFMVYFVVDAAGTLSLVLTFDKANDGDGGEVIMSLEAPELIGNTNIHFSVRDDNHEPFDASGKKSEWNPATGTISHMQWWWAPCCTDGGALSGFPESGFQMGLAISAMPGLNTFSMASQDPVTGEVTQTIIPADRVLNSAFTVEAATCAAYCEEFTDCGSCSLDPRCGWCGATSSCIKTQDAAQCGADYNNGDSCCSVCSGKNSCGECSSESGCAWDFGTSSCLSANDAGATCQGDPVPSWLNPVGDTECNSCPGGAWGQDGSLTHWCSGHGTCSWSDKTCTCDEGWGGAACDVPCPQTNGEICGGNGQCNAAGQCICDCGYVGASCETERCLAQCTQSNDNEGYCLISTGSDQCETPCGLKTPTNACTGTENNGTCQCAEGFYGPECDKKCPGATLDGTGEVCGGYGTCGADGQCVCSDCAEGGGDQICTAPVTPFCSNFGQAMCMDNEWACNCMGSYGNDPNPAVPQPNCDLNMCPGVPINTLTGKCVFTQCTDSQWIAAPGNATHDTDCRTYSPPCTNPGVDQYEVVVASPTSDRQCADIIECTNPGVDQYELVPPTISSQRECRDIVPCGSEQWLEAAATPTTPNICIDATPPCDFSTQYQKLPLTATSDRKCEPIKDCTKDEFQTAAPTTSTNRQCQAYTVCVTEQYESVAATPTSDRDCLDATKCYPENDEVEVLPLTPTSDRRCAKSDDCVNNKCQNGGVCIDGVLSYTCDCAGTGFAGEFCEYDDSCLPNDPCVNGVCVATAQGAQCWPCDDGWAGACCDVPVVNGQPPLIEGLICRNITAAGSEQDDETGASSGSSLPATAIAGIIAGMLAVLMIAGVAYKTQKNAQDVRDAEMAFKQAESQWLAKGGILNPRFGGPEPVYSDAAAMAQSSAEHEYSESNAGAGGANGDAVYAAASVVGGDPLYDAANGNAGGIDAVYAGASPDMYRQQMAGGEDPTYAMGAAANGPIDTDPVYGVASPENLGAASGAIDTDPVYGVASPENLSAIGGQQPDPVYGMASPENMSVSQPEALYAMGQAGDAQPEPTYGLASPEGEDPTYGLASETSVPHQALVPEGVYGLGSEAAQPEATYGLQGHPAPYAAAQVADDTYGLGSDGDIYSNSVATAENIAADDVYANSTEIAPGVVLSNEEVSALEADEGNEDVPDGYLQTYAARRSSLI